MTPGDGRPRRVVALDASVLINFLRVGRLNLLAELPGIEFVVPEQVVREVTYPEQARALETALEAGLLRKEINTATEEIAVFAELTEVLGRGEAACLAMAQTRGWAVAADERGRRFRRLTRERLGEGRVLNTPGILLLGIRADLITVCEADQLKARLEEQRFKMAFGSFGEVVDS